MINVIEIPVFVSDSGHANDLFEGHSIIESVNNGFKYCIFPLNDEKEIIFYILKIKEIIDDTAIFDRLIPKSPFCFILLKGETFIINNFCESYKERYSNPLICVSFSTKDEFDLTYIKNNVLKIPDNHIIQFKNDGQNQLQDILIESLGHWLKNQK